MNFWERLKIATSILTNRYEASQPSTTKRAFVPAFNRDARHDANSWSRWEMTRKIRYFERNVWLVTALRDEHVKWTVGPNGLCVLADSSDPEWNKRANESYQRWSESPCQDSSISMPLVHKQIAGSCHLENDVFIHKTRIKNFGRPAQPAIQLIESHRCSSPGTAYGLGDKEDIIDGVQLGFDESGRTVGPIGYWMIDNVLMDQWAYRNISDVYHVFDPERIGMYRGITKYHPVINPLHDVNDLELLEMERAKNNAEISNIITTPSGELNKDAARNRRFGGFGNGSIQNDSKEDDMDRRMQLYRKIIGARTIALKTGEKFEQVSNENPSAATQWFWRYKIGQICRAAGVPLLLIFPELIEHANGTVVRGIYDNAHETFRGSFYLYACAAVNIYRYYVNWARYNDPQCVDAPADWNRCHVIPPRAVNVDIGYTSQATIQELGVGITNWDIIAGRIGSTAIDLMRKKITNVADAKLLCAEISKAKGVDVQYEEAFAPAADITSKLSGANKDDADAEAASDPATKSNE